MIFKTRRTARQAILAGLGLLITVSCDHGKLDVDAAKPDEIDRSAETGLTTDGAAPFATGGANPGGMAGGMAGGMTAPKGSAAGAGGAATSGSAPAGGFVSGTITLAPEMQSKVQPGSVVFIIARMPGVDKGPPLATTRLAADRFPLEFRLGQENVMMQGMPFQGKISLSARLDGDGNAMTKMPGDIAGAAATPVEVGDHAVKLELNQPL